MYPLMSIRAGIACLAAGLLAISAAADERGDRLKRLVETIATGDQVAANDATEILIEDVIGPLASAVGAYDERPLPQRVRLARALGQFTAALRMRLMRAELSDEQRALYDAFVKRYPELTRRLFDDDPDVQRAALEQIPLEPETAAGLLLVQKIEDGAVADRAFELAARLSDTVTGRRLHAFVREMLDLIEGGYFKTLHPDYEIVVADHVRRAVRIIGEAGTAEAVPEILRATRYFAAKYSRNQWDVGDIFEALGSLGDERAAPLILEFLNESMIRRVNTTADERRITQTYGDCALLGLLRVYRLRPEAVGMVNAPHRPGFYGFTSTELQKTGHRAFRAWYRANADKPVEQRSALERDQPVDGDSD